MSVTVAAVFALPVAGAAILFDMTNTLLSFLMATVALYAAVLIAVRFRTRKSPTTAVLLVACSVSWLYPSSASASQPLDRSAVQKIYPMPARDVINVVVWGNPHGFSLGILQPNGRLLSESRYSGLAQGQYHTVSLNTSSLRSGIYILAYKSFLPGGIRAVRRFTIIR